VFVNNVVQIIGRIIELNDVADRGQPVISVSTMLHDSWDDMDEVFSAAGPHQRHQHQSLLHTSARLDATGVAGAPANTSFDVRPPAAPPVQVRETTM